MGGEERRMAWMLRKEKRQEFFDLITSGKTMSEARDIVGLTEFVALGLMELHRMIVNNNGKKIKGGQ